MSTFVRSISEKKYEFKMFTLTRLADELIKKNKDVIQLTIGIPEVPLAPEVIEEIKTRVCDQKTVRTVFPEGIPELREELAQIYNKKTNSNDFTKDNVIIGTGTSTIFKNLLYLLKKPGAELLIPRPYYSLYLVSGLLNSVKIKYYDIDVKTGRINFDSFRENYSKEKTAAIIVNSPGNPIGNVLNDEELKTLKEIIQKDTFIVFDQIYEDIHFNENKMIHPSKYFNFTDENVIYSNSFSKGYGMYTKRIGYCLAPMKVIKPMKIIQQHTLLCADPVNQFAALKALKTDNYTESIRALYNERSNYAANKFKDLKNIKFYEPKGGFYFTIYWENEEKDTSLEVAKRLLKEKYVSAVPGCDFGFPNSLRLAFTNDRFNEGIDRIYEFFNK